MLCHELCPSPCTDFYFSSLQSFVCSSWTNTNLLATDFRAGSGCFYWDARSVGAVVSRHDLQVLCLSVMNDFVELFC